jgi:enoyl-[acyl-carrier-protein] reductase (NADH)
MSMYGVNAGVPKTLIRYLVSYVAGEMATETLLDIVDTPISPELIPADEKGNIKQKTEDLVGPAIFLASDASNFVNGHVLYVDGGILAYIGKQP